MQKQKKIKIAISVVVVVFLLIWLYSTPYIAARNMKKAAGDRDPTTVSSYIDLPSLKESFKANLSTMIASEAAQTDVSSPASALGSALGAVITSRMVEQMATPQNIASMLVGTNQNSNSGKSTTKLKMGYEGINRFAITVQSIDNAKTAILVFHREGLATWKLASLRLPNINSKESQEKLETAVSPQTPQQYVLNLEPFVFEIQKKNKYSSDVYCQFSAFIVLSTETELIAAKANMPLIRSNILSLATSKSASDLKAAGGKEQLAKELLNVFLETMKLSGPEPRASQLSYTSFVIQ